MKIVFMGTPDFAVPALERLIESKHEICMVISQPDRPQGRGKKLVPTPVKALAEARLEDVPVLQPERIRKTELGKTLKARGVDAAIVVAYGQLLPKEILDAPRHGCFNIHASLLPEYRGAAPIQRCLMDGNSRTGVTIMQLDEGMDTGPVLARQEIEILPDDDAVSLENMLSVLGAEMIVKALDEIEESGRLELEPQDEAKATSAPMLRREEGEINWSMETDEIICRMRGMIRWPGSNTWLDGKHKLTLLQGEPLWSNEVEELEKSGVTIPFGMVTSLKKGFGFTVKTGDGHLLVTQLKPSGKKAMDGAAFLNGRGIKVGDRLGAQEV